MSLPDFRKAFVKYATEIKLDLPPALINVSDVELVAGINTHLRPFAHDMDLCYSNLQTLILASGYEIPELTAEQTAKVKRYIEALIKASE